VTAVRRLLPPDEADDALSWLNRLDSDRVQVAVLVTALSLGQPYLPTIQKEVRNGLRDYRDVLMAEYTKTVDYRALLGQLGLQRDYPLE
jgi:hypothetical protein